MENQELDIVFANDIDKSKYREFMIKLFNYHLQKEVPPERQEAVINRLVEEGLIKE